MFEIQNYTSFIAAIVLFQLIPGAGTLAIINATARSGIRVGLAAVVGTLLGDFVFMLAAVLGLAAVMNAHPLLFQALQWFGAAYLCWIGIQFLRAPIATPAEGEAGQQKYFRQAFLVSLTNPKVMLFFVAFFPLFLKPDASPITLVAMMAHVVLLSLAYQTLLVVAGNALARRLRSLPSARRIATRAAGCALIAFGLKLAAADR